MNSISRWFKNLTAGNPPEVARRIVEREMCEMTVPEWRADKAWVATAASVLRDPRLRQMLDTVANSGPWHEVLDLTATLHERSAQQARQEGYTMALANLRALGVEATLPERVEATFGALEAKP